LNAPRVGAVGSRGPILPIWAKARGQQLELETKKWSQAADQEGGTGEWHKEAAATAAKFHLSPVSPGTWRGNWLGRTGARRRVQDLPPMARFSRSSHESPIFLGVREPRFPRAWQAIPDRARAWAGRAAPRFAAVPNGRDSHPKRLQQFARKGTGYSRDVVELLQAGERPEHRPGLADEI